MTTFRTSAYVPCFNNVRTIAHAVASLRQQTRPPEYVLVVDDGSTDGSAGAAEDAGARVIVHRRNLGRGAARATAMTACETELVVCCDASTALAPEFIERALRWFDDPSVAAVYGRIRSAVSITPADRWRRRYLFREEQPMAVARSASLITGGAVVRRSSVQAAGGFDSRLRQCEDGDLGNRLLAGGNDVVFDPSLAVFSNASNTASEVLERYWRWNAGIDPRAQRSGYARSVWYAWRHMVLRDLAAADVRLALISCVAPHYCYWRSRAWSR